MGFWNKDEILSKEDIPNFKSEPEKVKTPKIKQSKCEIHKVHKRHCVDCEGTRTERK